MTAIGILLMAATLAYSIVVKPPDPKEAVAKQAQDIAKSKHETQHATEIKQTTVAGTQMRLWSDPDDRIAPKTLKILTDLAEKHGLKVSSFRPQKEMSAGALTILPFFVSLDGPFPAVGDYLREFEENQQTLIVTNVQIASSDQNTHAVTASIEVCAYIDPSRDAGSADVASKSPAKATSKSSQPSSSGNGLDEPGGSLPPEASKSTKTPASKNAAHSSNTLPHGSAKA